MTQIATILLQENALPSTIRERKPRRDIVNALRNGTILDFRSRSPSPLTRPIPLFI
ncbi:hypothetical protein AA0113_g9172 [Alternaria arborescens]|uniref:Uncharacterized protein n=1 Tax=Alternaria arborescens TaxID=156630 RepID=A0A4Q4RCH4_9PLEO|nr:hypothetical protein AA0112_g5328 [Alternaria arborescens]RYO54275.1 hypothetical protein AA0113_g9172 [Alternaria arborescens]